MTRLAVSCDSEVMECVHGALVKKSLLRGRSSATTSRYIASLRTVYVVVDLLCIRPADRDLYVLFPNLYVCVTRLDLVRTAPPPLATHFLPPRLNSRTVPFIYLDTVNALIVIQRLRTRSAAARYWQERP